MPRKNLRMRGRRRRHCQKYRCPPLRLTPYAWSKLLHLRDRGPSEVGGFGVSAPGDLLLVEDVRLVRQQCSAVTVRFDDAAVADYFDACVDQGLTPAQFGRIWIHTHPGNCPLPSSTDEATFDRCFGTADWAIMFILARGGRTYARLRLPMSPGSELILPVEIDYQRPYPGTNYALWQEEYRQAVAIESWPTHLAETGSSLPPDPWTTEHDPLGEAMFWEEIPLEPWQEVLHAERE